MPAFSPTSAGPLIETVGVPSLSVMVPMPVVGAASAGARTSSSTVSVGSLMLSSTVGIRTMKLVLPAGTVTVVPVIGVNVTPPSKETRGALVSVPSVAVPEPGTTEITCGVVETLLSTTWKSRLPPSTVLGLETLLTRGVSSVGITSGGTLPLPSSTMVTVVTGLLTLVLTGLLSSSVKVSAPSKTVSSMTGTVRVLVVSPGAKVSVPVMAL